MFKVFLFPLLLCTLSSCLPSAILEKQIGDEKTSSPFTPAFNAFVQQNLDYWHVPGLSVAIVDENDTLSKGYGISSFPAHNVTPHTLFYTASTTKAFTAAAFALLIDDSRNTSDPLSWQTPMSSLIRDDFVVPDIYATAYLTIEDALSHRTGMAGHDGSWLGHNFTPRDVVRKLRHLPLTEEIRTKFQYCNMMYVTISHVIETLTGSWLGDVFSNRIWKPLNMTRTFFSLEEAKAAVDSGAAELATPYMWNNVTEEFVKLPYLDLPEASGAGGIISTVLDYAKWLRFLIDKAPPLSKAGHEALRTPRIPLENNIPSFTGTQNYGLGWFLVNFHGEPLIFHEGSLPGFGTFVGYLPRKRYGVALMGNSGVRSNIVVQVLVFRLLADRLGVPEDERFPGGSAIEDLLRKEADKTRNPRKELFPSAPSRSESIPLSLPIGAYTGLYWNPGYGNISIGLASKPSDSSPQAFMQSTLGISSGKVTKYLKSASYSKWSFVLEFEHVSGEFFIIRAHFDLDVKEVDYSDPFYIQTFKAEFRIGEDGKVRELGALLEPAMGEEKIWFRKVE